MKTIKFYTVGCKVNQYDTQSIREQFICAGFQESTNSHPADIYLINTCTVTHKADIDSLNFIRRVKKENPRATVVVTGCLTELDSDKISGCHGASLIVRNKDKGRILELLGHLDKTPLSAKPYPPAGINELKENDKNNTLNDKGISYFKGHTRAFLKIQDGCNNFCSYCKVPLVRGQSRSKCLKEIIREAESLVKNGFKEIVLSGICLGSYGKDLKDSLNLTHVIGALENINGLLRIRLSSLEAGDVSDDLINKMTQSQKLCRHLHIPIQSGDDEILEKMNRKYRRDDYLNLIKRIQNQIPGIAITTDVLVGFPGESEINFKNTLELIKKILPLKVHIFPYSVREGTSAANNFKDKIGPLIIKERIWRLKNISDNCAVIYQEQFLNKTLDVLIESKVKENPDFWQGYTDNYIKVLVKSEVKQDLENRLIQLKLKKIIKNSLLAFFVDK